MPEAPGKLSEPVRHRVQRTALAVAGLVAAGTGTWLLLADPAFLPSGLEGEAALSFRLRLGAATILGSAAFALARLVEEAGEAADAESVRGAARGTRWALLALGAVALVVLFLRGFGTDLLGAGLVLLAAGAAGALAGLIAFAGIGRILAILRG